MISSPVEMISSASWQPVLVVGEISFSRQAAADGLTSVTSVLLPKNIHRQGASQAHIYFVRVDLAPERVNACVKGATVLFLLRL